MFDDSSEINAVMRMDEDAGFKLCVMYRRRSWRIGKEG